MFIDLTPEQKREQLRFREYFSTLMTPMLKAELCYSEGGGPEYSVAIRKMGSDGLLGLGWPKEHGGQEKSSIEQFLFFDEAQRAGFPIPFLTINTVGPTLARFGSKEQRRFYCPKILAGELHFSIGYTEPDAGTDLASLKTTAVREGDEFVINGQKIWTSLAGHADYMWLACRTDPRASKHKGISLIIVPANALGVSKTQMSTMGGNETFTCYYENVRVPVANLVGPENGGWRLITSQLNHERVALMATGPMMFFTEEVMKWARSTEASTGIMMSELAWVQRNFAILHAKNEVLKLMNWRQAERIDKNQLMAHEASSIKVFGSEYFIEGYRLLMEILGAGSCLDQSCEQAILGGKLERYYRAISVLTFGGGTNEVQRDIVATVGLGMPRSR